MRTGVDKIQRKILIDKYGKWLWVMREKPSVAAHYLTGIALPPHERLWLRLFFSEYKTNTVVASRGTSKTFSHASLAPPIKASLFKNLGILTVSASGFRGGKLLLEDSKRLILGNLKSQRMDGDYMVKLCTNKNIIRQDPDRWTIKFSTNSEYTTVPSNNEDNLRGIRANIAIVDERNTFPGDVVDKVILPWMNVGQSFRSTAAGGDKNQIFQVSTIDYFTRDWVPKITQARSLAKRQYDAQKALMGGDYDTYDLLMRENDSELRVASFSYTRIDYTDLLIPEYILEESTGDRYKVNYPIDEDLTVEDVLVYDERDKISYYYTYPVDKQGLEEPFRDGTMDADMWRAEQRNVFITSAGSVFPHELLHKVSERFIYEEGKSPGFEMGKSVVYEDAFFAPLMYSCADPCVIGLDYARESDKFAIVVIRLGELSSAKFNPFMKQKDSFGRPFLGKTDWNHICWAETWARWTAHEAGEQIRSLYARYNVICTTTFGGLGLDKGGGGTAVRDQLAQPKPPIINGVPDPNWKEPIKIYDPNDSDYAHYKGYSDITKYWGGLRLLSPGNHDNVNWVSATKAMMETNKLFMARWQNESEWVVERGVANAHGIADKGNPEYFKWKVGYDGIRNLKMQLLRIQMRPSSTGVIRYVMPGSREKEEGKKDLFSATIYGVHMAREHLRNDSKQEEVPMVLPILLTIGSDYQERKGDFNMNRGGLL
jgi:hypothetical protein